MHIVVGAIFVVLGATCVAYLWAGGSVLEREPPLLALGVLLIALAAGLGGRSRAAALLARAALGAGLVAIGWIATRYLSFGGLHDTDELIRRVQLLGLAVLAAAVVFLFILVRHVPYPRDFRTIDLVPLAGLAAALALGVAWFVGDDTRLRPCRLGNDLACDVVATHLIESAERAPAAPELLRTAMEKVVFFEWRLGEMAAELAAAQSRASAAGGVRHPALRGGKRRPARRPIRHGQGGVPPRLRRGPQLVRARRAGAIAGVDAGRARAPRATPVARPRGRQAVTYRGITSVVKSSSERIACAWVRSPHWKEHTK